MSDESQESEEVSERKSLKRRTVESISRGAEIERREFRQRIEKRGCVVELGEVEEEEVGVEIEELI